MAKKHEILEWKILSEDEGAWVGSHQRISDSEPALPRAGRHRWQWWGVSTIVLALLCCSAFILWRQAREGIAQIEAELRETAKLQARMELESGNAAVSMLDKQTSEDWQRSVHDEQAHLPPAFAEHATVTAAELTFDRDIAAVKILLGTDRERDAYRQMRFYRRTDEGWLRTAPDVTLWGPSRRLETDYFVFEFHQWDAEAVAAAQVDSLYTTVLTNFGLPTALAGPKLRIQVSPTQIPGTIPARGNSQEPFLTPSPALYLAPVQLTDVELLAQALALLMVEHVSLQAMRQYAIAQEQPSVLGGLRLWQLWDLGLPLSVWQDEVVGWVFGRAHAATDGPPLPLPEHYEELCATYHLWMQSPQQVQIPLGCDGTDGWEVQLLKSSPELDLVSPTSWGMPLRDAEESPRMYGDEWSEPHAIEHPGKAVAWATVFEYVMVRYGQEQLPALLAGFGTYDNWETLAPAVFGVSATDFEVGWQSYLAQQYNVPLTP